MWPACFESRRTYSTTVAPNVTNPHKGGSGRRRESDVASITTVDHNSSETLLDDWRTATSPLGTATVSPGCEGRPESDPSVMLGLVLVLVANTLVVAALVAAVVWILA